MAAQYGAVTSRQAQLSLCGIGDDTTPFTRQRLFESGLLEDRWIVDDPATLLTVVQQKFDSLKDS